MERSTIVKLLLAAAGIGLVVYISKQNSTPAVNAIDDLDIDTDPVPTSTGLPTATLPATSSPAAQSPNTQTPTGATTTPQTTSQAQALLDQAKAANPWLDFNKKLGLALTATKIGNEVKELQRLLGTNQTAMFSSADKARLIQVKGVQVISLQDWYLTPNKV